MSSQFPTGAAGAGGAAYPSGGASAGGFGDAAAAGGAFQGAGSTASGSIPSGVSFPGAGGTASGGIPSGSAFPAAGGLPGGNGTAIPPEFLAEILNMAAIQLLFYAYIAGVLIFIIYNLASRVSRYIRRMTTMYNDTQRFFIPPNGISAFKRILIWAPLFKSRHNTELSLGWIRFGIVPSRIQTLLLLIILGGNIYLLVMDITLPFNAVTGFKIIRDRAATLAVGNLVPLFFSAGRKNPLIGATGVDFSGFNTMHRWLGRLVVALIGLHAGLVISARAAQGGSQAVWDMIMNVGFIQQGYIAALILLAILLQSAPYLRKPFYETFLVTHQALVAAFIIFALRHTAKYWQTQYVSLAASSWAIDRAIRLINLLRNNVGKKGTKILAEVLPGDAMRVTVYVTRPWKVEPGQHLYLFLPGVSLWQNHPFSIAWSERQETFKEPDSYEIEKGGLLASTKSTAISPDASMSLIVRKRSGATSTLYKKAVKAGGRISCRALVEGPYGPLQNLSSYGTVLLFSGGVGITHHVPYIRDLVEGFTHGTVSCRKLVMIWAVRSAEHLEWVRPWMTSILGMDGRRDLLRIMIFVTRPDPNNPQALDVQSPSASVKMFPGRRPDIASIIEAESADQIGTMAISCCGSGPFSDAVRKVARERTKVRNIDFLDESFSW